MMRLTTTWHPRNASGHAVCLHGITGNSTSWWRIADHLASQGFLVTAPDLRGHGNSARPVDGYQIEQLIRDVVDSVGTSIDLLIGHSFGGTLALQAVATGALTSWMTVLEDPVIRLSQDQAHQVAETEIAWEPADVVSTTAAQPGWLPRDAAGRILAHYQMDPDAIRLAWTANAPWDFTASLAQAATLTQLVAVVPTRSPYINADLRAELLSTLGQRAVLDIDSGHSVHREAFEALTTRVVTRTMAVSMGHCTTTK